MASIIDLDDLPHEPHSHEFVGADHGDVPFSVILVHSCHVVVCEALSGGSDEQLAVISRLLSPLDYVATDPDAARVAGAARLERRGSGGRLGLGDALIAAVARGLDATIVTRNRPDFARQGASVLEY